MKNMKKITTIAAAFLMALAFMTAFADEALARPNWLGIKVSSWSLKPVKLPNGRDSFNLYVVITHTNNHDNRTITNIYDKTGRFTLKKPFKYAGRNTTAFTVLPLRSTKNNAVDLTPGESYKLNYTIPITNVDNGLKGVDWFWDEAYELLRSGGWKLTYSYDCNVKSRLQ